MHVRVCAQVYVYSPENGPHGATYVVPTCMYVDMSRDISSTVMIPSLTTKIYIININRNLCEPLCTNLVVISRLKVIHGCCCPYVHSASNLPRLIYSYRKPN